MKEYLGKTVKVVVDRPLGSKHPEHKHIYSVNYGYLEGTISGDGEERDVYILGVHEPIEQYEGVVIGIIKRRDDVEDKLVVANKLNDYDKYQIRALVEFQERFFDVEIITLDYIRSSIRNTVRVLIRRDDKVLMLYGEYDGEGYYFLPGGGVEFRESLEDSVKREVGEELDVKVIDHKFISTIENIFVLDGMPCHELLHLFQVELSDYGKFIDGTVMDADIYPASYKWLSKEEIIANELVVHPEDVLKYI